jgi:CBS domain-containing protein
MARKALRAIEFLEEVCFREDAFMRVMRTAEDLMTTDLKTLTLDDTVGKALNVMKENNIRHAAVMEIPEDDQGQKGRPIFIGVISQRDLFRYVSPYWGTVAQREEDTAALSRRLSDIVARNPASAPPETPIEEILGLMTEKRIDVVPILAGAELAGLVTAGDIVKAVVIMGKLKQLQKGVTAGRKVRLMDMLGDTGTSAKPSFLLAVHTVKDVMTEQVVHLGPKDTVKKAMETMREGKFRHVPILDEAGHVAGIVSDRDILLHLPPPTSEQMLKKNVEFRNRLFAVDETHPSLATPLEEVMKKKVVSIASRATIFEAANLLRKHQIDCLPVSDDKGRFVGLLTTRDLVRWLRTAYRMTEKS